MPILVSDLYVEVVPDFVVLHPVQFELLEWLLYLVAELVVEVHLMHAIQEELLLGLNWSIICYFSCGLDWGLCSRTLSWCLSWCVN